MTNAEEITSDALLAGTALAAIVGTDIWPDEMRQGKKPPAVTFERESSEPEYSLDNTLHATKVTMTVTGWAKTRTQALAIAQAAIEALAAVGQVHQSSNAAYVPELDEYAAVVVFEVWES